jgi:hypothetical protein
MLVAGAIIAALVSLTRGDVAYILVIAWAFAGIAVKQSATTLVAATASAMAALVLLTLLVGVPLQARRTSAQQSESLKLGIRDRW